MCLVINSPSDSQLLEDLKPPAISVQEELPSVNSCFSFFKPVVIVRVHQIISSFNYFKIIWLLNHLMHAFKYSHLNVLQFFFINGNQTNLVLCSYCSLKQELQYTDNRNSSKELNRVNDYNVL